MRGFRGLLAIALFMLGLCATPSVAEEGYPSRLVKIIVPFPPGSTLDALARIMTEQMAQRWGQPVIIENISGGGGNIGTDRFARSAPDGYQAAQFFVDETALWGKVIRDTGVKAQ